MRNKIAAVFLAFTLVACGGVSEGTVVDKNFKEAYTTEEEIMEQECENEKKRVGKKYKTVRECEEVGTGEFETVEHPAEYVVVLEDKDGDTGEVEVDQQTYNSLEIGEFYSDE